MTLLEKVKKDLDKALDKGYKVTKSFGAFQLFVKLSGIEKLSFQAQLDEMNIYLSNAQIVAFRTKKGIMYSYKKYFSAVKSTKETTKDKIVL